MKNIVAALFALSVLAGCPETEEAPKADAGAADAGAPKADAGAEAPKADAGAADAGN